MAGQKFSVAIRSDAYKNLINQTLGDKKVAQRFVANITSAVSAVPSLQTCDAGSIISAGLQAQALNLPISNTLGFCYILPYGSKAQFQIGWKGIVQMALATGKYENLGVTPVRAGDTISRDPFTGEPKVTFTSDIDDTSEPVGYYAYLRMKNGYEKTEYWTKKKVLEHAKRYSKAYSRGPWVTNFDAMAMKTVIKSLVSKWGYMTTEMASAFESDQAVLGADGSREYVDNPEAKQEEARSTVTNSLEDLGSVDKPAEEPQEELAEDDGTEKKQGSLFDGSQI